jgi:hypothetical protein
MNKTNNIFSYAFVFCTLLIPLLCGCRSTPGKTGLLERINLLEDRNAVLKNRVKNAEAENVELKQQITHLLGLGPKVNLSELYSIEKVKITRYTNIYDKDGDGLKEKLIVYIQPLDFQGDIVKANGTVDIQLWDLSRDQSYALLKSWHFEPEQLSRLWYSSILRTNYRLALDLPEKVKALKDPLTVKVVFTDYLTGKDFKEQHIIKPE